MDRGWDENSENGVQIRVEFAAFTYAGTALESYEYIPS